MPTVFRQDGFRFFFYSNEGDPREPLHVHVIGAGGEAKFWLQSEIVLADSAGMDAKTLRRLLMLVQDNRAKIERAWHDYFA